MKIRMAVFRAGRHTDSQGRTREWTREDLDHIAEKYNASEHEAPAVIGHPRENAPAYGWVEKTLSRAGDLLYAEIRPAAAEFADWLKKGLYKKRSISLYPDLTMKHVGFLGASPPAVKGLPDFAFSDGEASTMEFEELSLNEVSEKLRALLAPGPDLDVWVKEVYPGRAIVEDAGQLYEVRYSVLDDGSVSLGEKRKVRMAYVPVDEAENNYREGGDMDKVRELEGQLREKEAEVQSFTEKDRAQAAEVERLKGELAAEKARQRKAEAASFCEALEKEGKLTPAMKGAAMDLMEVLHGAGEYEFSEGGKRPAVDAFKEILSALPVQVEFKEHARKGAAGDAKDERERLISEFMAADKRATYKDAVVAVSAEHPELFEDR